MKLNRKGFTFIEVLAVITILAITLVVAIPTIVDAYKSAKQASYDDAIIIIEKYVNAAAFDCTLESLNNYDFEGTEIFDEECVLKPTGDEVEAGMTVSDYILKETNYDDAISSLVFLYSDNDEKYIITEALVTEDGKFNGVTEKKFHFTGGYIQPFLPGGRFGR